MKRRLRRSRGFTLVELMISLVMGLIVALAAVGLARTATTTFYEQARVSGVEANVRTASERLRNDLARAAYMSTPDIRNDRKLATLPGAVGAPYRIAALQGLQSIRIEADTTTRAHAYTTANNLQPHMVSIAGNMTSDDLYRGQLIQASGPGCGGTTVRLNRLADPAVRRLFAGEPNGAGIVQQTSLVFLPARSMNPTGAASSTSVVQVMDMRGCFHYLQVCNVVQGPDLNSVDLSLEGGVLLTTDTGGDVCGAQVMEEVAVAPVQRVRWRLGPEVDTNRIDPALDGTGENKFNLYRDILSADGTTMLASEVIAEYAVDLRLGLTVDAATSTGPENANRTFQTFGFEEADATLTQWAGPTSTPTVGPHRIRSVRYRIAFRTPFPDRRADLPMPAGPGYLSRYCMGASPCTDFARVRTLISEVTLLNQGRAF